MFRDLWSSVDREKAIDCFNSLKERNNSMQNTELHESRVVLNLCRAILGVWEFNLLYLGYKFLG